MISDPSVMNKEIRIDWECMQSEEAQQLNDYAAQIAIHLSHSAYGSQPIPEDLHRLTYGHPQIQELRNLQYNWDGYGSERPSDNVISKANDVWDLIVGAFRRSLPVPDVTPGSSGIIAFTWKSVQPPRQFELWIHDTPSFRADWCLLLENGRMVESELSVLDDLIPALNKFAQPANVAC